MELKHEPSDDSYCTTEDGENNRNNDQEEDQIPPPITETVGEIIKLKDDNIIKTITKVGTSLDKPIEIDCVYLKSSAFYTDIDTNEIVQIPFLCEFNEKTELNLSEKFIPRSYALAVQSMREGEECDVQIKFNYIFKFLNKEKEWFSEKWSNTQLFDSSFQTKYMNLKISFNITLVKFYMIQNWMEKSEIQKKILRPSQIRRNDLAKNGDIITYTLKCVYKQTVVYNWENKSSELDVGWETSWFDIEQRVVQSIRPGEYSMITVLPSFMEYKNKQFLEKYGLDNTEPLVFYCEVFTIEHFNYVYNVSKDKFSKSKILAKGIGLESPDRETHVKMKIQIRINDKIVFNSFENDDIAEYINSKRYQEEYWTWREEMNKKYKIDQLDEEKDYEKNTQIYNELVFPNLLNIDWKQYTLPNLFRKVLVHMKRNEIVYIKTSFLDYFVSGDCELNAIGKFNDNKNQPKIEAYLHWYDFLQYPSFSKYTYEEKHSQLTKYKTLADARFKSGKIYHAMKWYHNWDYRFDEGDVFGSDAWGEQNKLKETNKEVYDDLMKMRLNAHNNYALCKLKLGKIYSCYETCAKVWKDFDKENPKALYMHGKCCIEMKKWDEALISLKLLNQVQPENKDGEALLKEAQRLYDIDQGNSKKMFKRMLKNISP